ncbi:hypothetical protein SAMN05660477_00257 [Soonwooa buanensis]|uniref:Uncharacterized protein n=1 Tax=Soonwooa buanensis TaxID=619805 RepID=A0A1T5CQT9_9FLAO|nr:hypothetical protein [Soonwooa buanensis]SKB61797.1 hypothetical protein SAMN05660477_00257 [Soonwooa buanensis]
MLIKANYVIIFYIINILVGVFGILLHYEDHPIFGIIFSLLQMLFLAFGGFLNAKKQKKILSIFWIGIFNLILGLASIFAIEVLGARFSIFGGSTDSVLVVLFQYTINSYLYPFLTRIEAINESLAIIFIIFCSFIIPFVGFVIGRKMYSNKVEQH